MSIKATEVLLNRVRLFARARNAAKLRRRAMSTPFGTKADAKLLLISEAERIEQSQIFPFHYYADDLRRLYGAEVREADLWELLDGKIPPATGADIVAFQTPYDVSDGQLQRLFEVVEDQNPGARLVYLDWCSPADLRNAKRLDPYVDVYVKKHVFRDRCQYEKTTIGDTNLTDYYNRRFGLDEPKRCFPIPPGFFEKLIVGPSFATAPLIMPALLGSKPKRSRPIDVHGRFAVGGMPWYEAMRAEAEAALDNLSDLTIVKGEGVPLPKFLVEMTSSKIGFSPFGYGEVCWRDYEAVMAGAVLLKPDMSSIETEPDIFVPWETYVPVAWDSSDFEEVVRRVLADTALQERITDQAFAVLHDWLHSDAFARAMAPLFDQQVVGDTGFEPVTSAV